MYLRDGITHVPPIYDDQDYCRFPEDYCTNLYKFIQIYTNLYNAFSLLPYGAEFKAFSMWTESKFASPKHWYRELWKNMSVPENEPYSGHNNLSSSSYF